MLLHEIAQASHDVAATSARLAKVARLADCLTQARAEEISIAVAYLSGELPQGTIGVGWAALRELPPPAEPPPTLELLEVDAALSRLQAIAGRGSQAARAEELSRLFGSATEPEQRFLASLLVGELRQGALEGLMVDAVAKAAGIPAAEVRRAAMLAGDLPTIAEAALTQGRNGLARFRLTPLHPVKPMLAQTADDVAEALERIGPAAVEWKLDGARIQVHRVDGDVRVFTRNLADITDRVPEIAEAILALPADVARARRRGDRASRGRAPPPVPGDDEPLRNQGRSRRRPAHDAALGLLLRLPPHRRQGSDRPACGRAARRAGRTAFPLRLSCHES